MQVCIALVVADWFFVQPSAAHGRVEVAIQVGLQAHVLVVRTAREGEDRRWFAVDDSVHGFTLEFEQDGHTAGSRR